MFGTFDDNWRYSHGDVDAGTKIYHIRNSQVIDLIIRGVRVTRSIRLLWKRHAFKNRTHRENWHDRFQFTVEKNQVAGVYHKNIRGYVLWRDWYERIETPRGGIHLSRTNREIIAVVFDGKPVYRISGPTITTRLLDEYPDAFTADLIALEDLVS